MYETFIVMIGDVAIECSRGGDGRFALSVKDIVKLVPNWHSLYNDLMEDPMFTRFLKDFIAKHKNEYKKTLNDLVWLPHVVFIAVMYYLGRRGDRQVVLVLSDFFLSRFPEEIKDRSCEVEEFLAVQSSPITKTFAVIPDPWD